jgi:hypothetical protein
MSMRSVPLILLASGLAIGWVAWGTNAASPVAQPSNVPDAARLAIVREMDDLMSQVRADLPAYTVSVSINGKRLDFIVDAKGQVQDRKVMSQNVTQKVPFELTPQSVRDTLSALSNAAPIPSVEQRIKGDEITYYCKWVADGRRGEATVELDGMPIESTATALHEELPQAVRQAVDAAMSGGHAHSGLRTGFAIKN